MGVGLCVTQVLEITVITFMEAMVAGIEGSSFGGVVSSLFEDSLQGHESERMEGAVMISFL